MDKIGFISQIPLGSFKLPLKMLGPFTQKVLGATGIPLDRGEILARLNSWSLKNTVGKNFNMVHRLEVYKNDRAVVDQTKTKLNSESRINPKTGWVAKGHQFLFDIVFGWWLD